MKVSRDQVQENKRTILKAAGRLFRERGFESVTVTDVMKSAGLTHGGFYGYFKSKDDLITQALAKVFQQDGTQPTSLADWSREYLSPKHRDNFAGGCPTAALASESIRQAGPARHVMTVGLKRQIERLSRIAAGGDDTSRRRSAIGSWAAMVGAVILARMSDDVELSGEVLNETRAWLDERDRARLAPRSRTKKQDRRRTK